MKNFSYTQKDLIRFHKKIKYEYLDNNEIDYNGHMLFIHNLDKDGYGGFWYRTRHIPAHRFSFMVEYGPILNSLVVRHKNECNIRNCVNPFHLELGTQKDNIHDMIKLGTLVNGEDSNFSNHKNEQIVNLIYDIYNGNVKTCYDICKKYHMTKQNVSYIINGKIWKKVVNPILEELNITIDDLRYKVVSR